MAESSHYPRMKSSETITTGLSYLLSNSINMDLLSVDAPFPDPQFKGKKDCAEITFNNNSFDTVILIDKPFAAEVNAFSNGSMTYGLYKENSVPFITMEFKGMQFQASFNTLKFPQDELKRWLDAGQQNMNLYLVDANNYSLLSKREIPLSAEFTKGLKDGLSEQQKNFQDIGQVDLQIKRVTKERSMLEINNKARKFRIG